MARGNEEEEANRGTRSELNPGCAVWFVLIMGGSIGSLVGFAALIVHFV